MFLLNQQNPVSTFLYQIGRYDRVYNSTSTNIEMFRTGKTLCRPHFESVKPSWVLRMITAPLSDSTQLAS